MLLALLSTAGFGSAAWACSVNLDSPAAGDLATANPEFAWTTDCSLSRVGSSVPGSGLWRWRSWGAADTFTHPAPGWERLSEGPWVDGVLWKVQGRVAGAGMVTAPPRLLDINVAPSAPTIDITPADAVAALDDLVCEVTTPATDADGDSLTYEVSWVVDGGSYPRAGDAGPTTTTWTDDTVPTEDLSEGESWACLVKADDGLTTGDRALATLSIAAEAQPNFSVTDYNATSATYGQKVSPRDYLEVASGWYFGHAT